MRLERVQSKLEDLNLDGLIITDKNNWRYLTGFTGSNGLLFINQNVAWLFVDGRYAEQAKSQTCKIKIVEVQTQSSLRLELSHLIDKMKIGFEQQTISYEKFLFLNELFKFSFGKLVPTINLVEQFRMIKSDNEIEYLKRAAEIADKTLENIIPFISSEMTERDLANEIDYRSMQIGSSGPAFETIVASGTRTSLPHGHASSKLINKNELIMIDFGTIYNGYYSDITRVFSFRTVRSEIKDKYLKLLEIQRKIISSIRIGESLSSLDKMARSELKKYDLDSYFNHNLGHGIGLTCHEFPSISSNNELIIKPNMTFTVEPGIYIPNEFGIRIEDDILITKDGTAESLTKFSKEWRVLE